jgi:hypothetical protein
MPVGRAEDVNDGQAGQARRDEPAGDPEHAPGHDPFGQPVHRQRQPERQLDRHPRDDRQRQRQHQHGHRHGGGSGELSPRHGRRIRQGRARADLHQLRQLPRHHEAARNRVFLAEADAHAGPEPLGVVEHTPHERAQQPADRCIFFGFFWRFWKQSRDQRRRRIGQRGEHG